MMKWIKRILLSLLLLIIVIVTFVWIWLTSSKPQYTGSLQLTGLHQPVDIHFDEYGVPHIYAQNKHDLYMAFGYVHAQDRLFQMEMLRRAGSGRLSEIIGRPLLKVDKMFLSLGLTEYARESAEYLETQKGKPIYNDVQAYLEGVNYFVQHGATPPEFSIIGIDKTPFTMEDIYTASAAMAFSFSMAQRTEPVIDFVSKHYGEEYLQDMGLWHDSTESFIPTTNHNDYLPIRMKSLKQEEKESEGESDDANMEVEEEHLGQKTEDAVMQFSLAMSEIENFLPYAPLEGSNAWVLSGKKTKSGKVMFCNDTHIGYMLPQTWYEAHLTCPDFEIYGHHLAGIPFALIGRNTSLSWGVTMLENDEMDFYEEKFENEHSNKYEYKGEWKDAEVRNYIIKIKGEADTTIQVRFTSHGPVVSDAFEGMAEAAPISMYWAYTKHPNRTLDAFYGMNNSRTMAEFSSHLPQIHAPGLSINYGDHEGNIAWWACAALIKRPAHVNSFTLLDGTSGKDDALGYYPFQLNPRSVNPPIGYIYSANDWPQAMVTEDTAIADSMTVLSSAAYNKMMNQYRASLREGENSEVEREDTFTNKNYRLLQIAPMSSRKLWYPGYYKPQYRANRIRILLESSNEWDLGTMQKIICDVTNEMDSSMLQWFHNDLKSFKTYRDSTHFRQYDEMFIWNGEYDPRLPQPTFYNKMLYEYMHLAMADEMGEERFQLFMQTHLWQRTYSHLFKQKDSPWWDIKGTEKIETRRDIVYLAYCITIDDLSACYGNNPKVWTWQKACTLELKHPLGEVAILRPLFNKGPYGVWGGNETIMQAGFKPDSTGNFKVYYGSQMRIILDFAHADSSLNVSPSGQSGHIMSKHYSDQADIYRNKKFRTVWTRKEKILGHEKLSFTP